LMGFWRREVLPLCETIPLSIPLMGFEGRYIGVEGTIKTGFQFP